MLTVPRDQEMRGGRTVTRPLFLVQWVWSAGDVSDLAGSERGLGLWLESLKYDFCTPRKGHRGDVNNFGC